MLLGTVLELKIRKVNRRIRKKIQNTTTTLC